MIAHLKGREKAIEDLGFNAREAEWIALVALHSGVFLRSQYGRYAGGSGSTARMRALRLVEDLLLRRFAEDIEVADIGRVCRIFSRTVYRALGAEHIRHRKNAARPDTLRRLLSLDFVLQELEGPWLPTEPEKVGAFEGLGIERELLPKRVYGSWRGGRTVRAFGWKMPVAFAGDVARFVYVDTGGETHDELLSWGAEHLPLWSALAGQGIRFQVAAVSADSGRVRGAGEVLERWRAVGLRGGGGAGLTESEAQELEAVEAAIAAFDDRAMKRWGGLNGAIDRMADLQRARRVGALGPGPLLVRPDAVESRVSALGRGAEPGC